MCADVEGDMTYDGFINTNGSEAKPKGANHLGRSEQLKIITVFEIT